MHESDKPTTVGIHQPRETPCLAYNRRLLNRYFCVTVRNTYLELVRTCNLEAVRNHSFPSIHRSAFMAHRPSSIGQGMAVFLGIALNEDGTACKISLNVRDAEDLAAKPTEQGPTTPHTVAATNKQLAAKFKLPKASGSYDSTMASFEAEEAARAVSEEVATMADPPITGNPAKSTRPAEQDQPTTQPEIDGASSTSRYELDKAPSLEVVLLLISILIVPLAAHFLRPVLPGAQEPSLYDAQALLVAHTPSSDASQPVTMRLRNFRTLQAWPAASMDIGSDPSFAARVFGSLPPIDPTLIASPLVVGLGRGVAWSADRASQAVKLAARPFGRVARKAKDAVVQGVANAVEASRIDDVEPSFILLP